MCLFGGVGRETSFELKGRMGVYEGACVSVMERLALAFGGVRLVVMMSRVYDDGTVVSAGDKYLLPLCLVTKYLEQLPGACPTSTAQTRPVIARLAIGSLTFQRLLPDRH